MKHARVVGTALLVLVVGHGVTVHAQDNRGQRGQQPQGARPDQHQGQQGQQARVSPAEQHQRVQQEQQRATQYKQHLDRQVPAIQQQAAQLQAQKRTAQYAVQQQYAAQLRLQQQRMQTARDYSRDPYTNTPHTYRYIVGGATRQTNQYGADMLRQAVNDGYDQGYRAGDADRRDGYRSSYTTNLAYRDANYGYTGNYVNQSDYNYYFRQGFQRGYQDGYNRRSQYGTVSNGSYSILGSLLTSILGLQPLQ
jgi:hypothetical protein